MLCWTGHCAARAQHQRLACGSMPLAARTAWLKNEPAAIPRSCRRRPSRILAQLLACVRTNGRIQWHGKRNKPGMSASRTVGRSTAPKLPRVASKHPPAHRRPRLRRRNHLIRGACSVLHVCAATRAGRTPPASRLRQLGERRQSGGWRQPQLSPGDAGGSSAPRKCALRAKRCAENALRGCWLSGCRLVSSGRASRAMQATLPLSRSEWS